MRRIQGTIDHNSLSENDLKSIGSFALIETVSHVEHISEEPKMCVPDEILSRLVKCYSDVFAHVEKATRSEQTTRVITSIIGFLSGSKVSVLV
jgi:hypothetical protein